MITASVVVILCVILLQNFAQDLSPFEDAEGYGTMTGYIVMDETGSNQKGNVIELYTGPGESRFSGQVTGMVSLYRTTVLRDRVDVRMWFESEDTSLVLGSVTPMVATIAPGTKIGQVPIIANIRLATPMLNYSTGISPLVKITIWGEWSAQWNAGQDGPWDGGVIEPTYIYVHINPYHYLQMAFDPPMVDLSPGGSGEIEVIVLNTGNGNERVDLLIPNEMTYAKEGWIFQMNRTTLDIPPRSEARATIKVTAPRSTIRWHMDTADFSVKAISYYDTYVSMDEDREPISYEMTFMVYIFGLDFTYVPWAWAIVFWLITALVMFNLGVNPLVMRRRKLPKGVDPGFVTLFHLMRNPERRRLLKESRDNKRKLKMAERDRRLEEKSRKALAEKAAATQITKRRAPVLDLKPKNDDFDIEFVEPVVMEKTNVKARSPSDDDFDIDIVAPKKEEPKRSSVGLFSRKGKKKPPRSESDLASALDDL